jgi:hypothetical protein
VANSVASREVAVKCPRCTAHIHDGWEAGRFAWQGIQVGALFRLQVCPACKGTIIELREGNEEDWRTVAPSFSTRGFDDTAVPANLAGDYREAVAALPVSAKASAALSRRCLQGILSSAGYSGKDLAKQIDALLAEADASKAIPIALRETVDAIRNFGNFSAHPIDDKTTLQIIAVDSEEAEWCLELVEQMFEHFYVQPAKAAQRKAALNAKLAAAGKPPAK